MITGYFHTSIIILTFTMVIIAIRDRIKIPRVVGFIVTGIGRMKYLKKEQVTMHQSSISLSFSFSKIRKVAIFL